MLPQAPLKVWEVPICCFSRGVYFLLVKIVVFRVSWISRYIVRVRFVFRRCPANKVDR